MEYSADSSLGCSSECQDADFTREATISMVGRDKGLAELAHDGRGLRVGNISSQCSIITWHAIKHSIEQVAFLTESENCIGVEEV